VVCSLGTFQEWSN